MTALHYEIAGPPDAPPLILSGSLGADLSMWEPQLPLADRFRVIRVDTRGHGRSPAPAGPYTVADLGGDVLQLMDALALERVAFAGVSLGAMIGLWISSMAPQRLTGLVSICSAAHVPNGDAFRERAGAVRAASGTSEIADAVVDRWLTRQFAATHPDTREQLRAMIIGTDPEGYAGCARSGRRGRSATAAASDRHANPGHLRCPRPSAPCRAANGNRRRDPGYPARDPRPGRAHPVNRARSRGQRTDRAASRTSGTTDHGSARSTACRPRDLVAHCQLPGYDSRAHSSANRIAHQSAAMSPVRARNLGCRFDASPERKLWPAPTGTSRRPNVRACGKRRNLV